MTDASALLAGPLAGLRILLVEDDYVVAVEMERWLRVAGAGVVGPVARIDQALGLIDRDTPDAAVLDVNLDVGLGSDDTVYPLADRLDAMGVPYLFVTGDVRVARLPDYSRKPRLEKPLQEADLVAGLRCLLEGARAGA